MHRVVMALFSIFLLTMLAAGTAAAGQDVKVGRASGDELQYIEASVSGSSTDPVASSSTHKSKKVVINEIELNPRGNDVGREWIELYNPTTQEVDISNFRIKTSFKSIIIVLPSDAQIESRGLFLIELDRQILSNTAEVLTLTDKSDKTIDKTPSLVDRNDDRRTWQRMPDGNNEWQFVKNTKENLNDEANSENTQQTDTSSDNNTDTDSECMGDAKCISGIAKRIVDGNTLYVRADGMTYKVDLALVKTPSPSDEKFEDATSFSRELCLGSEILVDQDDGQTEGKSLVATVYCSSDNLNKELLENGYAELDEKQCDVSEFALKWARDQGC